MIPNKAAFLLVLLVTSGFETVDTKRLNRDKQKQIKRGAGIDKAKEVAVDPRFLWEAAQREAKDAGRAAISGDQYGDFSGHFIGIDKAKEVTGDSKEEEEAAQKKAKITGSAAIGGTSFGDFIGKYSDVDHPGCPRFIDWSRSQQQDRTTWSYVDITGHDEDGKRWTGHGTVHGDYITVYLSPEGPGAPSELKGKWTGSGIRWVQNGDKVIPGEGKDDWPKEKTADFIGKYSDVNHPGCPRFIHRLKARGNMEKDTYNVVIEGNDEDDEPWTGYGIVRGDYITVNSKSKGGPEELKGKWTGSGIRWVKNGVEVIPDKGKDDWPKEKTALGGGVRGLRQLREAAKAAEVAAVAVDAAAKKSRGVLKHTRPKVSKPKVSKPKVSKPKVSNPKALWEEATQAELALTAANALSGA